MLAKSWVKKKTLISKWCLLNSWVKNFSGKMSGCKMKQVKFQQHRVAIRSQLTPGNQVRHGKWLEWLWLSFIFLKSCLEGVANS